MIYEYPESDTPIRQGDIFVGLPRVDISLREMLLANEEGESFADWQDLALQETPVEVILPIVPVTAIVATQDCDAQRSRDITLCEIRPFVQVERSINEKTTPKGYTGRITQHARINQKWFYLPPDQQLGFASKMAADFLVTLCLPLNDLLNLRTLRRGRLNNVADEHFRERISDFFRRYPYDEWYALNEAELAEYAKNYPDAKPYPWQKLKA